MPVHTDSPYLAEYKRILADPTASFWLKDRAKELSQRDCLDALTDAEALVSLMRACCAEAGCLPKAEDLSHNPTALRLARAGRRAVTFLVCYSDKLPAPLRPEAHARVEAWLHEMDSVQPF